MFPMHQRSGKKGVRHFALDQSQASPNTGIFLPFMTRSRAARPVRDAMRLARHFSAGIQRLNEITRLQVPSGRLTQSQQRKTEWPNILMARHFSVVPPGLVLFSLSHDHGTEVPVE